MKHNIYFHVPKTGGHTVWSSICGTQIIDIENPNSYIADDVTWLKNHFGYPKPETLQLMNSTGGTFYISMRDPATHLVSFYNMIRMAHVDDDSAVVSAIPRLWDWKWEEDNLQRIIELDLLNTIFPNNFVQYQHILPIIYLQNINTITILNQETLDFDISTKMNMDPYESQNVTAKTAERLDDFEIAHLDNLDEGAKVQLYKFLETDYYWYNLFQEEYNEKV